MRARCADGGVTDSLLASPAFFGALAGVLGGVHCAPLTERVQLGPGWRRRRRGLERTFTAANNCAWTLEALRRYDEAKTLMRNRLPVARRVLGESAQPTLMMRWIYARALYKDPAASLDDISEAVTALEETERVAKRVLGGAHPLTNAIETALQWSRDALRARDFARETPSGDA